MEIVADRMAMHSPARAPLRVGWVVVALFSVSTAMPLIGLGSILRLVFPVLATIVGFWLMATGRREDFVAYVLWLFLLTPGLRRIVDFHAGWAQVNVLMLAPYTAAALSAGPVLRALKQRGFAYSAVFALVFACIAYGFVLAAFNSRLVSGTFDMLRWAVPPCFGLFIALDPDRREGYQRAVTQTFTLALILLSLYGIYQFLIVPPWDATWMRESGMLSIGKPERFLVRVFSTMNSPGSLAAYLIIGLLLVVPANGAARLPAIGLGTISLLLTLVRTSWVAMMVGFLFLLLFGASARARFSIIVGLVCLPLVLLALDQVPEGAAIIDQRISTLYGVQNDESYLDRSTGYRDFFYQDLPDAPFGRGLAMNGSYQSYLDRRPSKIVDGALIEIGTALGVFGGGAYLVGVALASLFACLASYRSRDTFLSSCGAAVAAQTFSLAGGMATTGEIGMVYWLAIGFCLAPLARQRSLSRPGMARRIDAPAAERIRA